MTAPTLQPPLSTPSLNMIPTPLPSPTLHPVLCHGLPTAGLATIVTHHTVSGREQEDPKSGCSSGHGTGGEQRSGSSSLHSGGSGPESSAVSLYLLQLEKS